MRWSVDLNYSPHQLTMILQWNKFLACILKGPYIWHLYYLSQCYSLHLEHPSRTLNALLYGSIFITKYTHRTMHQTSPYTKGRLLMPRVRSPNIRPRSHLQETIAALPRKILLLFNITLAADISKLNRNRSSRPSLTSKWLFWKAS